MTRPPDVATIARELQAMHQRAEVDGFVSVADAYRLAEIISAWDFYRNSQPANYQYHIDSLINEIYNCAVGVA
jgi:hypothetical protein